MVSHVDHCFVVANMPKALAKQKRVEGAVSSCLFESRGRGVHSLSSGRKGAGSQHLDLLSVLDFGSSVDDFLLRLEEFLGEVSELEHFTFDKWVFQLLYGSVDELLVRSSILEDALTKGMKGGLRTIARLRSQFDGEDRVSFSHCKVGSGACVVEYESYVFGFALIVVGIIYGRRHTESSVRLILHEGWTGVHITRGVVDEVLVHTSYHNWR